MGEGVETIVESVPVFSLFRINIFKKRIIFEQTMAGGNRRQEGMAFT